MPSVIAQTFGGLSDQYYSRQFVFEFALASIPFYLSTKKTPIHPDQHDHFFNRWRATVSS
jgi:hypothetical protein